MAKEERSLLTVINETLRLALRAEHDLVVEELIGNAFDPESAAEDARHRVAAYVETLLIEMQMLAERLKLPQTTSELIALRKETPKLAEIDHTPDGDIYVGALGKARQYLGPLVALVNPEETSQLSTFRSVLRNTAKIVSDAGLSPSKEVEVRNKIHEITSYCFTDAIREVPLPHSFKTYRGDLGIRSLGAVAEYKFAKTKDEMNHCLDGIFADMRGYDGHSEWQHFFAVFYMKEPFETQERLERIFEDVKAPANWTPIALNGPTLDLSEVTKKKRRRASSEQMAGS